MVCGIKTKRWFGTPVLLPPLRFYGVLACMERMWKLAVKKKGGGVNREIANCFSNVYETMLGTEHSAEHRRELCFGDNT